MLEAFYLGDKLRDFYPVLDYSDENTKKRKSKKIISPPRQIEIGVFE